MMDFAAIFDSERLKKEVKIVGFSLVLCARGRGRKGEKDKFFLFSV